MNEKTSVSNLISEFRKLNSKNAVSPDSLGYLLQRISNLIFLNSGNNSSVHVDENDELGDADNYVEPGLYYLGQAKTHLFVTSELIDVNLHNLRQYYFSESGLMTRQGEYMPGTDVPISWTQWESLSVAAFKNILSAVNVVENDMSEADSFTHQGLYYFCDDNQFILVARTPLKVVQYRVMANGFECRSAAIPPHKPLPGQVVELDWGDGWERYSATRVIENDKSVCEELIEPGTYYITDEPCFVTVMREGSEISQMLLGGNGCFEFRYGNIQDGEVEWQEWEDACPDTVPYETIYWSALVAKRNAGKLTPGRWYRIIDYVTTVANDPCAMSAGHQFDLLVLATSEKTLSEEARAVRHSGDSYFEHSKLDAWKVWYCLDNDTMRFAWADTVNGKGVIYRLVDEFGNDCPYDFKNVMFKRYKTAGNIDNNKTLSSSHSEDVYLISYEPGLYGYSFEFYGVDQDDFLWFYTFSTAVGGFLAVTIHDMSRTAFCLYNPEEYEDKCFDNQIAPAYEGVVVDNVGNVLYQCLNNIVFVNAGHEEISENSIGSNCYDMTFWGHSMAINIGMECYDIYGINTELANVGSGCASIFLGVLSSQISLGDLCNDISLGENSSAIRIENDSKDVMISNSSAISVGYGCANFAISNAHEVTVNCRCEYLIISGCNIVCDNRCAYMTITNLYELVHVHVLPGIHHREYSTSSGMNGLYYLGLSTSGSLREWNPADLAL